jgi:hypothetical protein
MSKRENFDWSYFFNGMAIPDSVQQFWLYIMMCKKDNLLRYQYYIIICKNAVILVQNKKPFRIPLAEV